MLKINQFINLIQKGFLTTNLECTGKSKILIYLDVTKKIQVAQALADRIKRELKSIELDVSKIDKLGEPLDAPFTVVITDQTMNDGILKLRYRIPKVTEEVHVTSLGERLIQLTK